MAAGAQGPSSLLLLCRLQGLTSPFAPRLTLVFNLPPSLSLPQPSMRGTPPAMFLELKGGTMNLGRLSYVAQQCQLVGLGFAWVGGGRNVGAPTGGGEIRGGCGRGGEEGEGREMARVERGRRQLELLPSGVLSGSLLRRRAWSTWFICGWAARPLLWWWATCRGRVTNCAR
jgi:hypothetical protein